MSEDGKERGPSDAALARLVAELGQARGRRRLDLILEAPDPEAVVQALPADDVYFLVRETGLADAVELVHLASPEQFRTFLDLDAWQGDRIEPAKALPWLRSGRAGALRSEREMARWKAKLEALDPELLSLVLMNTLRVHDLEEHPDPIIRSDRFMRTPEGKYVIEFNAEGTDYLAVRGLLDDLYAEDPFRATRAIAAVRWELQSELEESELRWRTGRLADLGFPDRSEALSWYSRPPSKGEAPPGRPERPAGFFLAQFRRGSLLDRAADRLAPADRERFERELVVAANATLVANEIDAGDLEAVRRSVQEARAMLEMGLSALASEDESAATETLAKTPLKRIFQHGFGRTLELRWRAERIFRAGSAGAPNAPLLDPPLGEMMAALVRARPAYFPGLEVDRADWGGAAAGAFEPRPFLETQELARTAQALGLAELLADLGARLGLVAPTTAVPQAPRLSALYLTALANERLGRAFRPDPIPAAELATVAGVVERLDDPRLSDEGDAEKLLAGMTAHRARELASALERTGLRAQDIDAVLVRP